MSESNRIEDKRELTDSQEREVAAFLWLGRLAAILSDYLRAGCLAAGTG
jgi:hypothetical protein